MSGWDWFWETPMMAFWIVLVGAVVYVTAELARGDRERRSHP
jgi:hypothetical protein